MNNPESIGIYAIIDDSYISVEDFPTVAKIMADEGIRFIQIRIKKNPSIIFLNTAEKVKKALKNYGTKIIVNDRFDIALIAHCDGVHLGQKDIPLNVIKKNVSQIITGVSTHNESEILNALREKPDYIGFGPLFPSKTKGLDYKEQGIKGLKIALRLAKKTPVVAIGGIKIENLVEIKSAGASGAAMISSLLTGNIKRNVKKAVQLWKKKEI